MLVYYKSDRRRYLTFTHLLRLLLPCLLVPFCFHSFNPFLFLTETRSRTLDWRRLRRFRCCLVNSIRTKIPEIRHTTSVTVPRMWMLHQICCTPNWQVEILYFHSWTDGSGSNQSESRPALPPYSPIM